MYGAKKKRAVDPNAPPRPTLLGHEKVIKDAKALIDQQSRTIDALSHRVSELERKIQRQADYLSALHSTVNRRR